MSPKYRVLEALSAFELCKAVQGLLDAGWRCQGGVSISYSPHNNQFKYAQAMVTG